MLSMFKIHPHSANQLKINCRPERDDRHRTGWRRTWKKAKRKEIGELGFFFSFSAFFFFSSPHKTLSLERFQENILQTA